MAQVSQEIVGALASAKADNARAFKLGYDAKRSRLTLEDTIMGSGSFSTDVGGMDFGKLLDDKSACAIIFRIADDSNTVPGAGQNDFVYMGWTPDATAANEKTVWDGVPGGLADSLKGLVFKTLSIKDRAQASVSSITEAAMSGASNRASVAGGAASKCPFAAMMAKTTAQPQKLNLKILSQPKYEHLNGDYAAAFKSLDMSAVKADLKALLRNSQDWWPADYGHYGPFFIRLAWHSAGTYRVFDGRGGANAGNMRFDPHGSWPDNGNLDKARRLLWPIKKKYGKALSWGDLMILVGNVSMEDMGFKTLGFGGGRVDCWATEEDAYWGEMGSFQGLMKAPGSLEKPLGAIQMELIYVNPEGPDGNPDPLLAAHHIRETFGRMAMNDEETVALIAGGHTFGKAHGAGPATNVGPCPKDAPIEAQGFGWQSTHGTGKGKDAITSGLEGAWTAKPTEWDNGYFHNLFSYEYELTTSPAGAKQWRPKNNAAADVVPDAFDPSKKHQPMMFTTDLSLKEDPAYLEISKKFHADSAYFAQAFAKAWYKLTHRDMGNVRRLIGSEVAPEQPWQDPVPKGTPLDDAAVTALKADLKAFGLTPKQMVATAWASASTFRHTDFRGGANGGRVFLAPQKDWEVNDPAELKAVQAKYAEIQKKSGKVSMADLIVLGGCVGVEEAAKKAGFDKLQVPFSSGRGDATQDATDVQSFGYLEPLTDGFRNHSATPYQLVDRAHLLTLTVPEMTCLVGGLRAMGINSAKAGKLGIFSEEGKLNNEWFVTLLDMATEWKKGADGTFQGVARGTTTQKFTATAVDLAFGSNPELRAVSEFYAMDDCSSRFVEDFAKVWAKVMDLDRSL